MKRIKRTIKKIIKKIMIKNLIRNGYEYFTISEGGKVVAYHFYKLRGV